MRSVERFATEHPFPFVILAMVTWILAAGVTAAIAGGALHTPMADPLPQSLGTLTATACLLGVMWRWGWLRAAGFTTLGTPRLWLVTVGLALYVVIAYQLAFFHGIALNISSSWASGEAQSILLRQAVVGVAEETLFRGFLLYALVRVWGDSRRGLLAAVAVPALIFGLTHIMQLLVGNPIDGTLMTILNAFVGGLWYGALVLMGGSLWPAVLIHAATNASVQISAASLPGFDPSVADYALATAAELPLVVGGLWLLLRKGPDSIPTERRGRSGKASTSAPPILGMLLVLLLAVPLLLSGCRGEATLTSTRAPQPTSEIETRLTAAERAAILDAAWQTVNDDYFDPTFGGKDWQAIGDAYRQRLATVEDDRTFWLEVLNPMLFELGVSHIGVLPPGLGSQMDPMTFATGSLGMDVRLLDGKPVVTQVAEGSPADSAGLRPGFVITAVDGRTPEDLAADGLQTPPDNERNQRVHLVKGVRERLYGETGQEVVVEYLDVADQPQRATLQYAKREGPCGQIDPSLPPACTEFEAKRLADGVGYIRFSGFLPMVLDSVLQAIGDLRDAPALIIDLRGNPGGVFQVRTAIASQLVGERKLFMRYQRRGGLQEAYLDPVPDAYPGQVVILVDEFSWSSSEEFAGSLQALGRATIVGSQTPGRCLVQDIALLPKGALLIYPFAQSQTPDGRVLEDNGVVPDIEVALDRGQLLQGVDAQLEAALTYLKQEAAARFPQMRPFQRQEETR
jgi:carboxyl-terminal processing protease